MVTTAREALRPGLQLGDFVLEAKLALGGMAEIWSARGPGGGADGRLALKVLLPQFTHDPAFVTMFQDEVRIATRLQHPNIVEVYGVHEAEGHLFQSMELLEGFDLRRLLSHLVRSGQRLPVPQALFIIRQIARALSYAHTRRNEDGQPLDIVHRDVSPHNVMLGHRGQVKLLDFGIARATERASRTRTGVIKGKLAYMAPEQALAVGVTPQTDIFATGVVLWEMLAMERLFVADTDADLVDEVVKAKVPPIRDKNPEVPEDVAALLQQMLRQRAPDRPDSMEDVARRLTRALSVHAPAEAEEPATLAHWLSRHGPEARPATMALSDDEGPADPTDPGGRPTASGDTETLDVTASIRAPQTADPTWPSTIDATPTPVADGLVAPPRPGSVTRPDVAPDVARTLVDTDMSAHLAGAVLGGGDPTDPSEQTPTPSGSTPSPSEVPTPDPSTGESTPTPATPARRRPDKLRRPTNTEIIRAVDSQATVEIEADAHVRELAQQIRVEAPPGEAAAPVGARAQSTDVLIRAPKVRLDPADPRPNHPTELGDMVPPEPSTAISGADVSGGYEPIGIRPGPSETELEAPPSSAGAAPAKSPWGWLLPSLTLILALVVLVLIFLLIQGQ